LTSPSLSGCTLSELEPLLKNHYLTSLSLTDCDLQGLVFHVLCQRKKDNGNVADRLQAGLPVRTYAGLYTALTELTVKVVRGHDGLVAPAGLPALEELHIGFRARRSRCRALHGSAAFEIAVTQTE
jgi:hypothetical protein